MNKLIGTLMGVGMLLAAAAPTFAATNVANNLTGPDSYNKIWVNRTTRTKVNNIQFAYVKNSVHSNNDTGDNKISHNTVADGDLVTGNATSNVTVNNTVNGAFTAIANCGCHGDINATNDTTGPDSVNKIIINDSSSVKVNNVQVGVVKNYITSSNETGDNSVKYNTVASGGITTGDASSNVVVDNVVNTSETIIGPVGP